MLRSSTQQLYAREYTTRDVKRKRSPYGFTNTDNNTATAAKGKSPGQSAEENRSANHYSIRGAAYCTACGNESIICGKP